MNSATSTTEAYLYNILTKSWNIQDKGLGVANMNTMSNIINYKDGIVHKFDGGGDNLPLNTDHTLFFAGKNSAAKSLMLEYVGQKDFNTIKQFEDADFTTKDLTAGVPHQRKRIYGVYVTYKADADKTGDAITQWDGVFPLVKLITKGIGTDEQTITLERKDNDPVEGVYSGGKGFVDTNGEWRTAHYKVASADLSKANNVYSIKVQLSGKWHSTFEVNDMSLIFRIKTPK